MLEIVFKENGLHKFEFSLIHVCAIDKCASRYLNYNVKI